MKKIIFLVFILIGVTLNSYALDVGDKVPDFTISILDGKQISYYSELKSKRPVYLIFWASW